MTDAEIDDPIVERAFFALEVLNRLLECFVFFRRLRHQGAFRRRHLLNRRFFDRSIDNFPQILLVEDPFHLLRPTVSLSMLYVDEPILTSDMISVACSRVRSFF